ncbi:MAG: AMIN domain-containing protein [Leptolyngbya sp. SIOISBB]|nr:AMIN domain-containing protein [Leptolyngbya sp. SIOISBB]
MRPRKQPNPKSSFGRAALSVVMIAGMATQTAIVAPARAVTLSNWEFDQASRALTITLPHGVTPDFFLLAEPTRIVLEIPNATLEGVTPSAQYSGVVRNIRLTEVAGGSRVVIELAPNTRLDPRHAELTATELGNGQTEWLLLPLLQDVPVAPVAAGTPAPTPVPVAAPVTPPSTIAPAPAPAVPSAAAAASETEAELLEAEPSDAAIMPVDESVVVTEGIEDSDDLALSPEDEAGAVAISVTPSLDSPAIAAENLPESASLPDVATSATVGAVQALPTGPDPLAGVSTDASALAGAATDNLSDLPPEQLPIDPFAASSQATVSVPSLAEADSTPAPVVSVPPLATVPDLPAVAQGSNPQPSNLATTPVAGVAPNQVRPPASQVRTTEPAVTATVPVAETAPATGIAPNQVHPPGSQSASTIATAPPLEATPATGIAPNQVRPPRRQNTSTIATTPPSEASPATGIAPNQVRPPGSQRASITSTAPLIEATIRPPTATTPRGGSPEVVAINPLGVPTVPLTPDSWRDYRDGTIPPNQVRPPNVAASAPSVASAAVVAAAALRPPGAAVQRPSETAVPQPSIPITVASEVPPFLPSSADPPSAAASPASTERRSIPPPPSIPSSNGTVPFGAPLPQSQSSGNTSQSNGSYPSFVPVGTRLPLQYRGTDAFVLAETEPVYESLVLTDNVYDPDTGMLVLPSGAQVLGRFEGASGSERRFVAQSIAYGRDRYPLQAASDSLAGTRQPDGRDVALSSGIGAAAVTVLSGFSSVGLLGGAARGALGGFADASTLVAISPGTTIEVEVVSDVLPFTEAPAISRQYP